MRGSFQLFRTNQDDNYVGEITTQIFGCARIIVSRTIVEEFLIYLLADVAKLLQK